MKLKQKQQFRSFAQEKSPNYFITSAKDGYVENGDGASIGFGGLEQKLAEISLISLEKLYAVEADIKRRFKEERKRRNKIVGGTLGGIGTVFVIGFAIFDVVKHSQNKKENKTKVPKAQVQQKVK